MKAVEYYLTEFLGSFVFLDADGNHYGLFTRIKEQIDFYCESKEAESAPREITSGSTDRAHKFFCHHNENNCSLPDGRVWEQYLFEAQKLAAKAIITALLLQACLTCA